MLSTFTNFPASFSVILCRLPVLRLYERLPVIVTAVPAIQASRLRGRQPGMNFRLWCQVPVMNFRLWCQAPVYIIAIKVKDANVCDLRIDHLIENSLDN